MVVRLHFAPDRHDQEKFGPTTQNPLDKRRISENNTSRLPRRPRVAYLKETSAEENTYHSSEVPKRKSLSVRAGLIFLVQAKVR